MSAPAVDASATYPHLARRRSAGGLRNCLLIGVDQNSVEFLSWRKTLKAGQVPVVDANKVRLVRLLIHAELAGIVVILLCAAIIARGGWR